MVALRSNLWQSLVFPNEGITVEALPWDKLTWPSPALLLPNTKGKFVDGSVIKQITETFENRTYNGFFVIIILKFNDVKNLIWTTKAKTLPFCPLHWPWLSLMLSVATFTASEHFICPDLSCQSSLSSLDPSLYYKTDKHAKSLSYDKIKIRVLFNKPHVNNCSKQ